MGNNLTFPRCWVRSGSSDVSTGLATEEKIFLGLCFISMTIM